MGSGKKERFRVYDWFRVYRVWGSFKKGFRF